ncbi:MAG: hypothetical protein HYV07_14790 [Deltaproteobacteria bacterium]|nr:hypothetical protein [Deltaproteobacteria bacterium]
MRTLTSTAVLAGVLIAASSASAEETNTVGTTTSSSAASAVETAPAEPAEEAPPPAEAPAEKPAETPAPPPAEATATEAPATEAKTPEGSAAPAATATTEAKPEEPKKPWSVAITVGQSLGAGAFVSEEYARAPAYGYAVTMIGSYKLLPKLSASARIDFDQQLTITNQDAGTLPREFFFRETRFGLSSPFFKEDTTGIGLTGGLSARLPTDKAGQAAGRVLGLVGSLSAAKTFEKLGPGDLSITLLGSFRKNFGSLLQTLPQSSSAAVCRPSNVNTGGDCLTSFSTGQYSVSEGLTFDYAFLEKFTFTLDVSMSHAMSTDLSDSVLPATFSTGVRHSPNAKSGRPQADYVFTSFTLAYDVTDFFNVDIGLGTGFLPPYIQNGSDPTRVRFPFFDFESTAFNYSSYSLNLNFTI